jgi:hypothetical protein
MATRRAELTITFHKVDEARPSSWWDAVRPSGGRVRGGYQPIGRGVIPHDLGHLATEVHLGLDDGFWGLLARGATFRRGTDRRKTRPGRALIAEHRQGLERAEALGNAHHHAWATGHDTPVAPRFEAYAESWRALPHGGTLTVHWPSGRVVAVDRPVRTA